jgi:uncharacterized protein
MTVASRSEEAQTALITGASSGIGLELATICAEHGHKLVLVARSRDRLQALAADLEQRYGVTTTVIVQDLAKPGASAKLVEQLEKARIQADILVNNAGFGVGGGFAEADPQQLTDMIQVNVMAVNELTRLLLPLMIQRGSGRILTVSSVAGFVPCPNFASYAATKAYVLSWSVALNQELRGTGVTATALCPGATKTNFARQAHLASPDRFGRRNLSAHAVALAGYTAMMKGDAIIVPSLINKLAVLASHLVSRTSIARLNKGIQAAHE